MAVGYSVFHYLLLVIDIKENYPCRVVIKLVALWLALVVGVH